MKILLTYFKPFGLINSNSSEQVASKLDVNKIGLDVSYEKDFNKLKEEYLSGDYDFIIMLGQSAKRRFISIEKRAKNYNNPNIKDNYGTLPSELIEGGNEEYLYTSFDINKLLTDVVKESSDAGSYLCNYLYYKVLSNLTKNSLFIHLPLYSGQIEDETIPSLDLDLMVREIKEIIKKINYEL